MLQIAGDVVSAADSRTEVWPQVLEKALRKLFGGSLIAQTQSQVYKALTGNSFEWIPTAGKTEGELIYLINTHIEAQPHSVILGTTPGFWTGPAADPSQEVYEINGWHSYVVEEIYEQNGAFWLLLYNPAGNWRIMPASHLTDWVNGIYFQ